MDARVKPAHDTACMAALVLISAKALNAGNAVSP